MRVLRVPVTWFLYICPKIPTQFYFSEKYPQDPRDMRDIRDMRDMRNMRDI